MTAAVQSTSNIHYETKIQAIKDLMQEASQIQGEGKVDKLQAKYNEVFRLLKEQGFEPKEILYQLLYKYASETCYGCRDEGFEQSGKLMHLSLFLQLSELQLVDGTYDLAKAKDINDLINNESVQKPQHIINNEVLLSKLNPQQRETMAKTVVRLAFSYQNIPSLNASNETNLKLHETLDALAKALIQDKLELAEFLYNRCSFLVGLKDPKDFQGKIASYDPILEMFKTELPEQADLMHQKRGQIYNMKGILTMKGIEGAQEKALEHWEKGIQEYRSIKNMNDTQEFLLNNLYSSYADLLVDRYPKNKEKLALAEECAKSMESFMLRKYKEGVIHPYFKGYASTIAKVRAALNS